MDIISYFKMQAKNFMRDFKTQYKNEDDIYQYTPRFFPDIDEIIVSFDIDEDNFTLMNCQHIIAYLAGFKNWSDLLHASTAELEQGKLLFDNRQTLDSVGVPLLESWNTYQNFLDQDFDDQSLLNIFKHVYLNQENSEE